MVEEYKPPSVRRVLFVAVATAEVVCTRQGGVRGGGRRNRGEELEEGEGGRATERERGGWERGSGRGRCT